MAATWNASEYGSAIWDENGKRIATVHTFRKDDARLMAAAPRLLTGVEQACAALDMVINSSDTEGAMFNADQTLIALRALLHGVKS